MAGRLYRMIMKRVNYISFLRKQGMKIGGCCVIHRTASFDSEPYLIEIGNKVTISSGAHFATHDGGVCVLRNRSGNPQDGNIDLFGRIVVGDNVLIGTNAIIMPGVTIGSNCIIGCGAVVTRSVPDNSVAAGVPACVMETIDEYYEKHAADFDRTKNMSAAEKKEYLLKKYGINAGK